MNTNRYLTLDETAALLRLGQRTTYRLARTGRLPDAAKVGGQWRVDQQMLSTWLKAGGEAGGRRPAVTEDATQWIS